MVKKKETIPNTSEDENTDVVGAISTKFWETEISDQAFLDLYDFNGVAFRACEQYVGDLTSDKYETNNSQFEDLRKELNIDEIFNWATNRAFVSGVSFIFVGIPDNKELEEPLETQMVADFLQVLPKSWFVLDEENKPKLENELYEVRLKGGNTQHIHQSRLIKVTLRKDEKSSYLPAYRALTTQDNNLWSIGQSFFRGAAGLTHVKIRDPKKVTVSGKIQNEVDVVKTNGTFNSMNSETTFISDDRYEVQNQGVQGQRVSVKESWESVIVECSIPLRIPWQMLIGANAGAIAGSETNQKDYFGNINQVRMKYLNNLIQCLSDFFGLGVIETEYDTLFEETDVEKAEIFNKAANSAKALVESGATTDSVISMLNEKFDINLQAGELPQNNSNSSDQGLQFECIVIIAADLTREEAAQRAIEAGFRTDDYEFNEFGHNFFQFRNIVPGSRSFPKPTDDPLMTIVTAEIEPQLRPENIPEEFGEFTERVPGQEPINQEGFFVDQKPFFPETLPPQESPWEKEKFVKLEQKAKNSLNRTFNNHFEFKNIARSMKGAIFFDKFGKDAEAEALLVIEQEVESFDKQSKLLLSPILVEGINATLEEANNIVGETIEITERNKQIQKQIQQQAMDKVSKASDEMRGDLRRELEEAMINEESPSKAAKRFRNFVSADFANKYKNRLNLIATQEMNTIFNASAQASYEDSGIVKFNQWITAGDPLVRPEHQQAHGQVVEVGKQFSLGVIRPPHGVGCRCAIVPFFPKNR